jgi:hypothetical protein
VDDNPARALHRTYAAWKERGLLGVGEAFDVEELVVVRAMARIDVILLDLERDASLDATVYRKSWRNWWLPFRGFGYLFDRSDYINDAMLIEIGAFADFLDERISLLSGAGELTLREALRATRDALEADSSLSLDLRLYISRLVDRIDQALNDWRTGIYFDYSDAVTQLVVAMRAAEGQSTPRSQTWHELWTQIVSGIVSGAIVSVSPIVISAITGS